MFKLMQPSIQFQQSYAVADVRATVISAIELAKVSENRLQEHGYQLGLPCNASGGQQDDLSDSS